MADVTFVGGEATLSNNTEKGHAGNSYKKQCIYSKRRVNR